jgi:ubiquinone/menaquinone biosynthesis C-methylase UbiE
MRSSLVERDSEHMPIVCPATHALVELCFSPRYFQSTLRVEQAMEEQRAPRTKGVVIDWAAGYDLLAWLLTHGRERELRERMVDLAGLEGGNAVLDIGCGTGTLAIAATRHVGTSGTVTGIDASPSMVARAIRKAARAGARAEFQVGVAEKLAFPDSRFDVVLSTLMLHHLPRKTRQACAREIKRVLRTGGRVLAVDFGRTKQRGLLAHFHRHGHVDLQDIVALLGDAGLTPIRSGPVGVANLNFVLAEAPGREASDHANVA